MESNLSHTHPVAGKVHVTEQNGIYTIVLGSPEERVVTITSERMESLKETVRQIKDRKPKGLIITGPSGAMFAAGADIHAISSITDPIRGKEIGREGQAVFQMIEDLPCPTVAAISGPCVGGGCELALACKYRVLSDHPSTQIGLPETKLGILPGWGGTQRLPRLIGIQKALEIILPGKTLRPAQAKKVGLVHEVISGEKLLARAGEIAAGRATPSPITVPLLDKALTYTKLGRFIVKRKSEAALQKETRGNYPAQPAALKAVLLGLEKGTKLGYEHEAAELGRLLVTPESRSLVNLFFLSEGSKRIGKAAKEDLTALSTLVVGAGIMGAGIAGVLAEKGIPVRLQDTSDTALTSALAGIRKGLEKKKYLSATEREKTLQRLSTSTKPLESGNGVNFVVEAIVEKLDVKKEVLGHIASEVPDTAILCTNTSSLSITEIAAGLPQPGRVIGMHFFNPVDKMPLVEIVRGKHTDDRTVVIVAGLATKLGKFPIVVEDVPGFLVNRILTPYLNESGVLLSEGVSMEEIDRAALAFGMPMGPIRLLDEVGLDVAKHVSEVMVAGYGERMASKGLIAKLCEEKMLGKKSKLGFYDYSSPEVRPNARALEVLKLVSSPGKVSEQRIIERLVLSLVNEGVRCLDEGVAGIPGKEAANQVDLGTVMGIGFPPFRGGLLSYAERLTPKVVLQKLRTLEKECGARFSPHSGIVQRAEQNKSFYEAAAQH